MSEREMENLQRDLETGLIEAVPGLEVLDRDLELAGPFCADFVGVEASGRLVLVLLVEGEGDAPALAVLDALAYGRANLGLLARHLNQKRLRTDREPLVVLVADNFSAKLLERLAPLPESSLKMLEVREMKSSSGSASYLVPPPASTPASAIHEPADAEAYVRNLPEKLQDTANLMVRRVARIDEDLECTVAGNGLQWRYQGNVLCSLAQVSDRLEGLLADSGPARGLLGQTEVDAFVEQALERYIHLLDGEETEEDEDLAEVELIPRESGVLLSPEEIEAFRQ